MMSYGFSSPAGAARPSPRDPRHVACAVASASEIDRGEAARRAVRAVGFILSMRNQRSPAARARPQSPVQQHALLPRGPPLLRDWTEPSCESPMAGTKARGIIRFSTSQLLRKCKLNSRELPRKSTFKDHGRPQNTQLSDERAPLYIYFVVLHD
jgi:hypothetical protein